VCLLHTAKAELHEAFCLKLQRTSEKARMKQTMSVNFLVATVSGTILMFTVLVGLSTGFFYFTYKEALAAKQSVSVSRVQALKEHAERVFSEADQILRFVQRNSASSGGFDKVSVAGKRAFVDNAHFDFSGIGLVFLLDHDGLLLESSGSMSDNPPDYSEQAFFLFHQNSFTDQVFVGPPAFSLVSNRWAFTVSRSISNSDGSFAGVVLAEIDCAYFEQVYQAAAPEAGGSVSLLTADGIPLVHIPHDDSIYRDNTPFSGTVIFDILSESSGFLTEPHPASDTPARCYSFRHLDTYPAVLVNEYTIEEAAASWRKYTLVYCAFLFLLLLLVAFLTVIVVRQFDRLREVNEDLTEKQLALESMALKDSMTGLVNRAVLHDRLTNALSVSRRYGNQYVGLLFMDIDHFKDLNDTYGHLFGDEVLKVFADRISGILRVSDTFARMGGDEFVVMVPLVSSRSELELVARKIELALRDPFAIGDVSVEVRSSIGYALSVRPESTADSLISEADNAMYLVKQQHRRREQEQKTE